jgi:peptidoglycan/xylan/chitin deacetylase (PgdA/CDA1 family)
MATAANMGGTGLSNSLPVTSNAVMGGSGLFAVIPVSTGAVMGGSGLFGVASVSTNAVMGGSGLSGVSTSPTAGRYHFIAATSTWKRCVRYQYNGTTHAWVDFDYGPLYAGPPPPPDLSPDWVLPTAPAGQVPLLSKVNTAKPVVFLTIDNGNGPTSNTPSTIGRAGVKATVFLGTHYVSGTDQGYWSGLLSEGSVMESFTDDHGTLLGLDVATQQAHITAGQTNLNNYLAGNPNYKANPVLFRAPGGASDTNTLIAANNAGMKAVVKWSAILNADSTWTFGGGNTGLVKGDIVLMHFYTTSGVNNWAANIAAFYTEIDRQGLTPVLLESWVTP